MMLWRKPILIETNLGLEINGYTLIEGTNCVKQIDTRHNASERPDSQQPDTLAKRKT